MSFLACSEASKCCAGMAQSRAQHPLRGNNVFLQFCVMILYVTGARMKKGTKQRKEKSVLTVLFAPILAEGAIALSVTLSGGALFASLKTTPIPVNFDRQGHSCNFYGGFGPTCCLLSESHFVPVLIASPAFCQPELFFRS